MGGKKISTEKLVSDKAIVVAPWQVLGLGTIKKNKSQPEVIMNKKLVFSLLVVILIFSLMVPVVVDAKKGGNGGKCENPPCSNPDGNGLDKPGGDPPQGDQHDHNNGNGNDPDGCDDNNGRKKKCDQLPPPPPPPPPPGQPTPTPFSPNEEGGRAYVEGFTLSFCKEHIAVAQPVENTRLMGVWIYPVDRANGNPTVSVAERFLSTYNLPNNVDYTHPSLDPMGTCREIVQAGDEKPSLWVLDVEGGNAHQLMVNGAPIKGSQPSWGWGNIIVYVGPNGLVRTDPAGKKFTPLGVTGTQPTISPSGNWVAYSNKNLLHIVSINGVVYGKYETGIECPAPEWDPDGSAVICKQSAVGLQYVIGEGRSIPIYKKGTSAVMDPTGLTPFAVMTLNTGMWLVSDLFHIDVPPAFDFGSGETSDWYAPGTLHEPEEFVYQFN